VYQKRLGVVLVTLLGLALLVYSAARSLDFITMTLPPDDQILAWFGLAALDGGLVFWLVHFIYSARGGWQRAIALLMVIVDFLGAVAMFTLDTLYHTVSLTLEETRVAVLALSAIIAINIASTIATHLFDPDVRQRMIEEDYDNLVDEETERIMRKRAKLQATQIAPSRADYELRRLAERYQQDKNVNDAGNDNGKVYSSETQLSVNPTRRQRSKL
jgi:hypothetical protein